MKKIICLCLSLAFVAAMMISCNKECVCTRSITPVSTTDTTATTDSTQSSNTGTTEYYHGGNIYDKQECEYLNGADTTATEITSFTCSWEKKEKKSKK